MRALALCELPVPLLAALALGVFVLAARDALGTGGGGTLRLDAERRWHVTGFGRAPFAGRLLQSGYRGGGLIVLVIENDVAAGPLGRERRRVAVPVDAIEADGFSFLHLQLACAGETR